MNTKWILALSLAFGASFAWADDTLSEPEPEREPAAVSAGMGAKRNYPGGADEEDLQVQPTLPEAALHTDARTFQRDVYKSLFNQELKDDRQDAVEE